jgi:hypothetical protein
MLAQPQISAGHIIYTEEKRTGRFCLPHISKAIVFRNSNLIPQESLLSEGEIAPKTTQAGLELGGSLPNRQWISQTIQAYQI